MPEGRFEHITYDGSRPDDDALRRQIGLAGDYLYIVATAEQERRRRALASDRQRCVEATESPVLKFDQVMRREMGVSVLTRTEDRICLRRAIERATQDAGVAEFVRHDVFTWLEALQRLEQEGFDLSGGISEELRDDLVSQEVGDILVKIHEAHECERERVSRRSFERVFGDWLPEFEPPPVVVMDGFTYLFPLQRRFIERCVAGGARVVLVYPDRPEQRRGFAVMHGTYAPYPPASEGFRFATLSESTTNLACLQRWLFADETLPEPRKADGTVVLSTSSHRHHEIADCVERIAGCLSDGIEADEIAVVMRQPAEFQRLLQEEARRRNLNAVFAIEPRQLLLTPLGRFVLTLYEIHRDGMLEITPDQFETMLASGWLGSIRQDTVDQLAALRPQLFERCRSINDWLDSLRVLEELDDVGSEAGRLATLGINARAYAARWRDALRDVERLCARLFDESTASLSIEQHVERLLNELTRLDPGSFRQVERELVERVTEVLRDLGNAGSIDLSASEFGEVLNSLIKEYETDPEAGQEAAPPSRIWITTPEGIDGAPREVVFYLGVDDQRVPRPPVIPWPRYVDQSDENQARERYMFLTVVRSATKRLYLSFAKRGEQQAYRGSVYFDETNRLLNDVLEEAGAPCIESQPLKRERRARRARRDNYRLDEIAIFGLCPYRYLLERLNDSARHCRDAFQLRFVAQGHWFWNIFEQSVGLRTAGAEPFRELLHQARSDTRDAVRRTFHGLRENVWTEVEHQVRNRLDVIVDYDAEQIDNYGAVVERAPHCEFVLDEDDFSIRVDADIQHVLCTGRLARLLNESLFHQHWMLPSIGDSAGNRRETFEGLELFSNLYHASQWWQEAARIVLNLANSEKLNRNVDTCRRQRDERQREIQTLVQQIERGQFPKHPGDHCQVCPARHACLGVPE